MTERLAISAADRVMVVAPHPDDESLAAGALLQRATAAGAAVRVVYFTDGDRNPWAQRAVERRLRIGLDDRQRFAARRRQEALDALAQVGVPPEAAIFLGLPDQGVTDLLLRADAHVLEALADATYAWRPTIAAVPHPLDLHPDHNALAVLTSLCHTVTASQPGPREVAYLMHGAHIVTPGGEVLELPAPGGVDERKLAAILCHRTQLFWRRSWMLGFAARPERFYLPLARDAAHPVGEPAWTGHEVTLPLATHSRARAFGSRTLHLVGSEPDLDPLRLTAPLPRRGGWVTVVDLRTGQSCGRAHLVGSPRRGELRFERALLRGHRRVLVKIDRRFGFFDEAGWLALSCPNGETSP